jgi:hypothetical protein
MAWQGAFRALVALSAAALALAASPLHWRLPKGKDVRCRTVATMLLQTHAVPAKYSLQRGDAARAWRSATVKERFKKVRRPHARRPASTSCGASTTACYLKARQLARSLGLTAGDDVNDGGGE